MASIKIKCAGCGRSFGGDPIKIARINSCPKCSCKGNWWTELPGIAVAPDPTPQVPIHKTVTFASAIGSAARKKYDTLWNKINPFAKPVAFESFVQMVGNANYLTQKHIDVMHRDLVKILMDNGVMSYPVSKAGGSIYNIDVGKLQSVVQRLRQAERPLIKVTLDELNIYLNSDQTQQMQQPEALALARSVPSEMQQTKWRPWEEPVQAGPESPELVTGQAANSRREGSTMATKRSIGADEIFGYLMLGIPASAVIGFIMWLCGVEDGDGKPASLWMLVVGCPVYYLASLVVLAIALIPAGVIYVAGCGVAKIVAPPNDRR